MLSLQDKTVILLLFERYQEKGLQPFLSFVSYQETCSAASPPFLEREEINHMNIECFSTFLSKYPRILSTMFLLKK
jgi:hypothetical protein